MGHTSKTGDKPLALILSFINIDLFTPLIYTVYSLRIATAPHAPLIVKVLHR